MLQKFSKRQKRALIWDLKTILRVGGQTEHSTFHQALMEGKVESSFYTRASTQNLQQFITFLSLELVQKPPKLIAVGVLYFSVRNCN